MGMVRPNFMEKSFAGGSKTVKFVNVFSLESFLCYKNNHTIVGPVTALTAGRFWTTPHRPRPGIYPFYRWVG